MTQISRATVLRLAQLSRLQLSDTEVDALAEDITNILGYVEQLDELNTDNIEPSYQVTGLENVWREDIVRESAINRDELISLASSSVQNQVKVPRVL